MMKKILYTLSDETVYITFETKMFFFSFCTLVRLFATVNENEIKFYTLDVIRTQVWHVIKGKFDTWND